MSLINEVFIQQVEVVMLSIVVLICSLSTQPQDCDAKSARLALQGGETASVMSCSMEAQAMLGRSALKPDLGQEYAKIECLHNKVAQQTR